MNEIYLKVSRPAEEKSQVLQLYRRVQEGPASDGTHNYFSVTEGLPTSPEALGRGLDVKGFDRYVVAPGSVHSSGAMYTMTNDMAIAPLLGIMVNQLRVRARSAAALDQSSREEVNFSICSAMTTSGR